MSPDRMSRVVGSCVATRELFRVWRLASWFMRSDSRVGSCVETREFVRV